MRRVDWLFNKGSQWEGSGALELDSRIVRCFEADGTVAWTRKFHTRLEAESCFEGDLCAMRKNGLYQMQERTR